ncbi:MAG: Ig-like domain-containing protein, partial [Pseudomonadota bacterium]
MTLTVNGTATIATGNLANVQTIAALDGGGYVTVWNEVNGSGGHDVYYSITSAAGVQTVASTQVNNTSSPSGDNNATPDVVALSDGGFMIAWANPASNQLRAQQFDAAGAEVGSEFVADSTNEARNVAVVELPTGEVVFGWYASTGGNNFGFSIFSGFGTDPVGSVVPTIGQSASGLGENIFDIATWDDGTDSGFVVVWGDVSGTNNGTFVQRFNEDGSPKDMSPTTLAADTRQSVSIDSLADGGFVVATWQNPTNVAYDVYSADGTHETGVLIGGITDNGATVTGLADGGFVITYQAGGGEVAAMRFDANGNQLGSVVNISNQAGVDSVGRLSPSVDQLANGDVVVVWNDEDGATSEVEVTTLSAPFMQTVSGFSYEMATSTGTVNSFAEAEALLSGTNVGQEFSGTVSVINFENNGSPYTSAGGTASTDFPNLSSTEDDFAIRFTGSIEVPAGQGGTWTFRYLVDDGLQVSIDGATEITQLGGGVNTETVFLTAGSHDITVLFYERDGGENVYLEAQSPSGGSFFLLGEPGGLEVTTTLTAPPNTAPEITGGETAAISVAENQTAVTDIDATDADAGDTITYSISGGDDAAFFSIDPASGVLTFTAAPDFENEQDVGMNNTYVVEISASDGTDTDTQTVTVTVTDVDEIAPTVTITDDEPGTANINGGAVVYTFQFSEEVTGFETGHITVNGGSVTGVLDTSDNTTFTVEITPDTNSESPLEVSLAGGVVTDLAGNGNAASLVASQPVDTLAPGTPTVVLANDTGTDGDLVTNDGSLNVMPTDGANTIEYSTDDSSFSTSVPVATQGSNTVFVREVDP